MARAAVKKVAQAEIRAAKSFLERRGLDSDDISPKKFAKAAKELDKGFQETLQILARELSAEIPNGRNSTDTTTDYKKYVIKKASRFSRRGIKFR